MIKTIIFDFGDVFINLDKPAIERELNLLGVKTLTEEMYQKASLYERGLISTEEFQNYFTSLYPSISAIEFTKAWNSIILDFPQHRLDFIKQLSQSKSFNLILLSNTNTLHIEQVIKNMTLNRYHQFKNCFNKFYLSHEINLSKPHLDIYKFVLNENNLKASECLFIDDTPQNTEAAATLGIHVWNNSPKTEDIVNLFTIKKHLF